MPDTKPLNEQIGYINRDDIIFSLPCENSPFVYTQPVFSDNAIHFAPRSTVEANKNLIQPIPVAVITNEDKTKVLAVKKQTGAVSAGSSEDGKTLIYVGGHMSSTDADTATDASFLSLCKSTLKREVEEELGIEMNLDDITPFYIYAASGGENNQHMAVCFIVSTNEDSLSLAIDTSELVKSRKSGKFTSIETLRADPNLEEWSEAIFEYAFE